MKQYFIPKIEVITISATEDIIRTSGLATKDAGECGIISMNQFDQI